MQIKFAFLKSKVAKRIFILFIFAAIIPVTLTGVLSYKYVTSLLVKQKLEHISSKSKAYGMSIFDRLVVAESQLISLENILLNSNQFELSAADDTIQIDSKNAPLFNNIKLYMKPDEFNNSELEHLLNSKSVITTVNNNDSIEAVFTRSLKKNDSIYILSANVDLKYIFGDMDIFAGDEDTCVVTKNTGTLNCSDKSFNMVSLPSFEKFLTSQNDLSTINVNNNDYLVTSWELFLKGNFKADSWFVYYTIPKTVIFSSIKPFTSTLAPLLLLSILLVSFVSINQISKILVPLEKLKIATIDIAKRDFSSKVELNSKDEFQILGDSFNKMSHELGEQFTVMSAMSNLDRTILKTMNRGKVIEAIFINLKDFIEYEYAGVLIFDKNNLNQGTLNSRPTPR